MDDRLTSLATVIAFVITALLGVFIVTGPGYTIELAIVSALALAGWLRFSYRRLPAQVPVVAPYILAIVLYLVLATCRYWSGYPVFLQAHWPGLFTTQFTLTPLAWMVACVFLPVSAMLLGGYYLAKRTPIGFYMAWWTFVYVLAEGLLHVKVEFLLGAGYDHKYFLGGLAALALLVAGVNGAQVLLRDEAGTAVSPAPQRGLTPRQVNLWTAFLLALAAVYGIALYLQAGPMPVVIIVGAMMGGIVGWRRTTAQHPADPHVVVPLYLLLLALFYLHVGEEAIAPVPFNEYIAQLTGIAWPEAQFTLFIALIGPVVWVFGAWSLWHRQPFGNFILWFVIVGMILGEPVHILVFPVVLMQKTGIGYEYGAGMYTALFPMIPAILALASILRAHRSRSPQAG